MLNIKAFLVVRITERVKKQLKNCNFIRIKCSSCNMALPVHLNSAPELVTQSFISHSGFSPLEHNFPQLGTSAG